MVAEKAIESWDLNSALYQRETRHTLLNVIHCESLKLFLSCCLAVEKSALPS